MNTFLTRNTLHTCLSFLLLLLMTYSGRTQESPTSTKVVPMYEADYMNQALKRVFRKAQAVTQVKDKALAGYGFDRTGACLWGTYLKVGSENTLEMVAEGGKSYFLIAAGDDFVKNIDIVVTDKNGRIVAKDTESGKEAGVLYKPQYSGLCHVILRLKAGDRFGLCALACLKRPNGWLLNKNKFAETTDVFKRGIQQWWKSYKGAAFLHNGDWSLVMGVLEPGKSLVWSHTVPAGLLGITTAHDGFARDLDLYLRTPPGAYLKAAVKSGSTPSLTYLSTQGGTYSWEVKATSSKGPTLIAVALLELPKR